MSNTRPFSFVAIILVLLLAALAIAGVIITDRTETAVASFEECVAAGNPVMESYPRQCRSADGQLFVEEIDESAESSSSSSVSSMSGGTGSSVSTDRTPLVQVYFASTGIDPQSLHCEQSYAVERKVENGFTEPMKTAIELLLAGPTETELAEGYFTSIPEGVKLQSIEVREGVAYVDFSEELRAVAGSCRVSSISSQIQRTLLQFPTVADVVISINGDSEEVLQP